jgi:hypothetical protein
LSDTRGVCLLVEPEERVREHRNSIEWIIANTISETAQGDPDALAARIIDALEKADYQVSPDNLGSQPFDELKPSMRPQDIHGDGKDWIFETSEHGGDEPDTMPQAIKATDGLGRWAIYVPLSRNGKIVIPRPEYDDNE